jgi:hypothetical protein
MLENFLKVAKMLEEAINGFPFVNHARRKHEN